MAEKSNLTFSFTFLCWKNNVYTDGRISLRATEIWFCYLRRLIHYYGINYSHLYIRYTRICVRFELLVANEFIIRFDNLLQTVCNYIIQLFRAVLQKSLTLEYVFVQHFNFY